MTPTDPQGIVDRRCRRRRDSVCLLCRVSTASSIHSPSVAEWRPNSCLVSALTASSVCSLTLIDSSLPSEAEPELRTYISRRLSKGALLGGMGNIATVELRYYFFFPPLKPNFT